MPRGFLWLYALVFLASGGVDPARSAEPSANVDSLRALQVAAIETNKADWGYWGADPGNFTAWGSHSNRLIPVYTFGTRNQGPGVDLSSYTGPNSVYRHESGVRRLYGRVPDGAVHADAEYLDQTNIYDLQKAAIAAGKKYVFLVIFDGMDWQTTQAAAIYKTRSIPYTSGRGTGLHFLDYSAGSSTQFGWMCTAPHNEGTEVNVDTQTLKNPGGKILGGYNPRLGGFTPWDPPADPLYPIAKSTQPGQKHAYTDSSSSASSMTAGIKTSNDAVNVDHQGVPVRTIAHDLQAEGFAVGAVTSVPISHATPAAAYAVNVSRDDYQDLSRDLLGLKSISHPEQPLPGLDLLIGGGFGEVREKDLGGGKNFVPGNVYLTDADLKAIDRKTGGRYLTAVRQSGVSGREALLTAARQAAQEKARLLGFYGVGKYKGHLPYQTADGDYRPGPGRTKKTEEYTPADLAENPTLADMTQAALIAWQGRDRFWLMVEAGDVDWANHDDNIDNAIGAVLSGDAAVQVITDWVERHSNWNESLLIVTADHGHYFHLTRPEALIPGAR